MMSTAPDPMPKVGTHCRRRSSPALLSVQTARTCAAHEADPVMAHEFRVYLADVHGVFLAGAA